MFIAAGAAIACCLLVGFFFAFVLTIRKPLSEHLHVEEARLRVGRWVYLAMVPTLLFSGLLVDKWGDKQMLFAGLLLTAGGFTVLGACRSQRTVIVPLLMLGVAAAWIVIATTLMLPGAFFMDRAKSLPAASANAVALGVAGMGQGPLAQGAVLMSSRLMQRRFETPTAAIAFGYVFVALGTLLAPVIVGRLCASRSFKQTMVILGLVSLVPALLVAMTSASVFPRSHPDARLDFLLRDPRLWMAVGMMMLYLPLERSLPTWADRYLVEMEYEPHMMPRFLVGFWIVFIIARLATAFVLQPGFEMWLVFVLVIASASTLGNLVSYHGQARGGIGIPIIGGCFGPILPILLSVLTVTFAQAPATVLGIVFGAGFLSNAIFQPALVSFARAHTINATVRIPMLAALLLAAPTLMLTLIWRQVSP